MSGEVVHTYVAEDAVGGRQGSVIVPARQVQARLARCSQRVCPHGMHMLQAST